MNKKIIISLAAGILVSAGALYFSFKNVPFADLVSYLKSINYVWVIPASIVVLASFYVRAVRWRFILKTTKKVSMSSAYHPLMIGFMMNSILPARIGEVARPVILRQEENVPVTTGLATVGAERVFDLAVLLAMFVVVIVTVDIDPDLSISFSGYELNRDTLQRVAWGMVQLSVVALFVIVFINIEITRNLLIKGIKKIPSLFFFTGFSFKKKVEEKVVSFLIGIVENISMGFSLMKKPHKIAWCLVLSVITWGLQAMAYYVFSLGSPGINLNFLEITAYMVIICFFIALPSVPGFWGLWEAGGVFALALFGISSDQAAGFTLANHAVQMFPVIVAGLISAFITGIDILQVSSETKETRQSPAGKADL